MTTGIRLSYAACFLQDVQSTWLLESKHLFHMDSGMLGHALSLDCTGFWNDINISSGVSAIFFFYTRKRNLFNGRIFKIWEEVQFASNRGIRGQAKLSSKLEESLGPGRCEKSLKKGLSVRLRKELAREEAVRDFRRISGRIKGKKPNSKSDFCMIKSMRLTLLNLELLAEFPWHQKLMLSPFLQQGFPSLF